MRVPCPSEWWDSYHDGEEDSALAQDLLERVAAVYGLETDVRLIEKAIFKGNACGAWIEFTETGLSVGSIVEGSDVDCTRHDLKWTGEENVAAWLESALDAIEIEADLIWRHWNLDEEDPKWVPEP